MHSPLDTMVLRTALNESRSGEEDRLNLTKGPIGGAFGAVRSSGAKPHAGWDMYAPAYAICDGTVVGVSSRLGPEEYVEDSYGNHICFQLDSKIARAHGADELFAFYGHLSSTNSRAEVCSVDQTRGVRHVHVKEGAVIGWVGRSGMLPIRPLTFTSRFAFSLIHHRNWTSLSERYSDLKRTLVVLVRVKFRTMKSIFL
jgi:murein DD-endopeptidase MepM/ murein hydrolase activator NlpD